MGKKFVAPVVDLKAFNCPHCDAYAQQDWWQAHTAFAANNNHYQWATTLRVARCTHCSTISVWINALMVWPAAANAPLAHSDMPPAIATDYNEARSVLATSPRSSAALLRLCVQKLCKELGEPGENINTDIGNLVRKGLSVHIQQALDVVRVVGNEQVHPGTLDVRDNPEIAAQLFSLVNFIVDDQISKPKAIAALYSKIPEQKLKGIADRDKCEN